MKQLKHLEHVEDLVFDEGFNGIKSSLAILSNPNRTTLKIDGSPSIVAGHLGGRFFVATKSFFNKDPKINYTFDDIKRNHPDIDLQNILGFCLIYLPMVIKSGIVQGDFLFDSNSKEEFGIIGDFSWAFTPNTIEYRVTNPVERKKVDNAAMGIVFHTSYLGNSHDNLVACNHMSPSVLLQENKLVWWSTANVKVPKENEYDAFVKYSVSRMVNTLIDDLNEDGVDEMFVDDKVFGSYAKTFINYRVKNGMKFENKEEMLVSFFVYLESLYTTRWNKYKTEKKRDEVKREFQRYRNEILLTDKRFTLMDVFDIHNWIQRLKENTLKTWNEVDFPLVPYHKGNKTNHEGFVVKHNDYLVKFVDRFEFSRRNFLNVR